MGGTLGTVVGADRELYNPEKTGAAEVLIRAGQQDGQRRPGRLRPPG